MYCTYSNHPSHGLPSPGDVALEAAVVLCVLSEHCSPGEAVVPPLAYGSDTAGGHRAGSVAMLRNNWGNSLIENDRISEQLGLEKVGRSFR